MAAPATTTTTTTPIPGWTAYGPLPTAFIPPSTCTPLTYLPGLLSDSSPRLVLFNPSLDRSCFPSQYPSATFAPVPANTSSSTYVPTRGYFSPGRCPSGFVAKTLSSSFVPAQNTLAVCCPSGYDNFRSHRSGTICRSAMPYSSIVGVVSYDNGERVDVTASTRINIGTWATDHVVATGINVMWKKGDLPDWDREMEASASAAVSVSAAAMTSAGSGGGAGWEDGGMLMGTKIAIGVCVPMAVIMIAVFVFVIWRLRYTRRWERVRKGTTGERIRHLHLERLNGEGSAGRPEGKGLLATAGKRGGGDEIEQARLGAVTTGASGSRASTEIEPAPATEEDTWTSIEPPPPYTEATNNGSMGNNAGTSRTTASGQGAAIFVWNWTITRRQG